MTDPGQFAIRLIDHRHDPDAVMAVLETELHETDDPREFMATVMASNVALTRIIHKFCHMIPKLDDFCETIVAAGPASLDASLGEAVPADDFLSDAFTRKVWFNFTEGTDPLTRTWGQTVLDNGQRVLTLDGPGFPQRVFAPVGATDEMILAFLDKMNSYESH